MVRDPCQVPRAAASRQSRTLVSEVPPRAGILASEICATGNFNPSFTVLLTDVSDLHVSAWGMLGAEDAVQIVKIMTFVPAVSTSGVSLLAIAA